MHARHPCNAARLHAPETQNKNAQMAAKLDQHSYSSHSKTRELMILTETLRVFDMFPLLQITFHPKNGFPSNVSVPWLHALIMGPRCTAARVRRGGARPPHALPGRLGPPKRPPEGASCMGATPPRLSPCCQPSCQDGNGKGVAEETRGEWATGCCVLKLVAMKVHT